MTVPNAYIVGVNKAGTTAVFNTLSRQRGVSVSFTKETGYFDALTFGEPLPPVDVYESLFPRRPERTVLEATPSYFYGGERVAKAIKSVSPNAKVLVILREPGSRAFSWWRFCRTRLYLPQSLSFSAYLDKCEPMGLSPEHRREDLPWRGLSGGRYDVWLPEWQSVFGDNLLLVFQDDLHSNSAQSYALIAQHFDIHDVNLDTAGEDNVSVDIRNAHLQKFALRANNAGERIWRRYPKIKKSLLSGYYAINSRSTQSKMQPAERERLSEYYAPTTARLRQMLPALPKSW